MGARIFFPRRLFGDARRARLLSHTVATMTQNVSNDEMNANSCIY